MIIPYAECTPREFLAELIIVTDVGPQKLVDVIEPWQQRDYDAFDNALRSIVALPPDESLPRLNRFYWEYGRGHSKTTSQAIFALFAVYSAHRTVSGLVAAADQDQARLLIEAARLLVRENPRLSVEVRDPNDRNRKKPLIEITQNRIRNVLTGSYIEIISSDSASAYGHLVNLIILDELTNWKPNARPLFDALISTAAKKTSCVVAIIANAPFVDSWQWEIREACRTATNWHFSRLEGPQASWITDESLEEQRQLLPPMAYRRLWGNEPVEGQGDALGVDVIDQAFAANVPVMMGPGDPRTSERWAFVGALDLSVSRDWSAFVVVGRNRKGRYRLARTWVWRPTPGQKISQEHVRQVIHAAHRTYNLRRVVCDPFQAEATVELLRKDNIRIDTRPQSGTALMEQAMTLVELFNTFAIDLPQDADLRRQLLQTRVEQRSYGLRLVSPRTTTGGHGDIVTALSIALPAAQQVMPLGGGTWGGHITGPSSNGLGGSAAWTRPQSEFAQSLDHADHLHRLRAAGVETPYVSMTRETTDMLRGDQ